MEKRYCQENITVIFPDDWDFCLLFSAFLYVSMFKPEDHIPCMAYKGTVVADGQQCPVVALQQMLQALHGIHIHVVGGWAFSAACTSSGTRAALMNSRAVFSSTRQ